MKSISEISTEGMTIKGPTLHYVICINEVFVNGKLVEIYKVGKQYEYRNFHDPDYNYDWIVFCAKYNHYQFTNDEFYKYFKDIKEERDKRIDLILEVNI
jgi:hypothetical protein